MVRLKVRKVGNSLGVTLPAQAAQALHVKEGDQLYLTEAPGGFRLTPYDPDAVRVAGGGQSAWFVTDLIPTAAHVRIPFVMGYDVAAIETMAEKRALLERACDEGAWICLEHDPETALARPTRQGEDFAWAEKVAAGEAPPQPARR